MFAMLRAAMVAFLLFSGAAQAGAVFPTLKSEDLNGDPHALPGGLPGDPTIVFIAYKQGQQPDVNTWLRDLALDPSRGPEFVELPVVGTAARMMKSVIDNGMRSGIIDTAMRARTITIYESAASVNAPLGFQGRSEIRVLIVKQDGSVLWSTSGPATPTGVSALRAAFAAAQ